MAVNLFDVTRDDLDRIQDDTSTPVTFNLYTDSNVYDAYGHTTKTAITIRTSVILSPVTHKEALVGSGIDETAEFKMIVHRLELNGVDYINSEWFVRDNCRNVEVTINNRIYRVVDKRGHTSLPDNSPYHVLYLARRMDV